VLCTPRKFCLKAIQSVFRAAVLARFNVLPLDGEALPESNTAKKLMFSTPQQSSRPLSQCRLDFGDVHGRGSDSVQ